jgi:hypothetical protein
MPDRRSALTPLRDKKPRRRPARKPPRAVKPATLQQGVRLVQLGWFAPVRGYSHAAQLITQLNRERKAQAARERAWWKALAAALVRQP